MSIWLRCSDFFSSLYKSLAQMLTESEIPQKNAIEIESAI